MSRYAPAHAPAPVPARRPAHGRGSLAAAALALALACPAAAQEDFATCWEHYEASRWKQAATCFEGLMAEYDDWAWGHHYLGVSYHGAGRLDDALKELTKAADLMGADAEPGFDPFYMAAVVLEAKGQTRQAMDMLKRGEQYITGEQRPDALALRGRLSHALGTYDKAIADLESSGKKDFETWYYLGTAHYQRDEFAEAADALEKALKLKPDHADTAHFLSLSFFKRAEATGDDATRKKLYARAADVGRAILQANPKSAEAHNLIGRALMGSGDYDGAESEFQAVLKIKPTHCFATANLASLRLARKAYDDAVRYGEKALGCLPADAKRDTLVAIGDALAGKGKQVGESAGEADLVRRAEAVGIYRKAVDRYEQARGMRASSALTGRIDAAKGAIADLEGQAATIKRNEEIEAENRRIEEENRKRDEMKKAVEAARSGSDG